MATLEAIKIQPEAIAHALSDNSLTVPVNQRSYAWEDKHVTELFQDLANAIATREGEYFLGSIVVSKTDGRPEVVDGQQRLATTTILLAAIRDHFYSTKDLKRAEYIEQKYLMSRDLRTEEILPLAEEAAQNIRRRPWQLRSLSALARPQTTCSAISAMRW